jgi:hypothetical protein
MDFQISPCYKTSANEPYAAMRDRVATDLRERVSAAVRCALIDHNDVRGWMQSNGKTVEFENDIQSLISETAFAVLKEEWFCNKINSQFPVSVMRRIDLVLAQCMQ